MKKKYIIPGLKMIALSPKANYMSVTSGTGGFWSKIDSMTENPEE